MRQASDADIAEIAGSLDQPPRHALVVEIGRNHVEAAVVEADGRLLAREERLLPSYLPPDATLNLAAEIMHAALGKAQMPAAQICGVGATLPGTVRSRDGLCLFSPVLQWDEVQVGSPLEDVLGLPPLLINTVQAIGLGELHFGAGRECNSFACVNLGTGIGGSLILSGRLHSGDSDSAGEIGHITVDPDGLECACGNQGCLETVASGPAIARMAEESVRLGAQSILADWTDKEASVTAEMVLEAAERGDALAIKIWEKVGRYVGLALSTLITLVNPGRIILGGRVSRAFSHIEPTLREEVRRRARVVPRDFTDIVPSPLGTTAALVGTAAACFLSCTPSGNADPLRAFEAGTPPATLSAPSP